MASIPVDADVLGHLLDPVLDCMTPEMAARLVELRIDDETQKRLDDFADRNREGQLSPEEHDFYEALVRTGTLISMFQAKARRVLQDS